ncbi:hypothetical protein [Flavobacterium hungaricum]|uniref:Lipoprotein n=1 Tax=Flavobacterium hungaricum TaxID=2082725 RepID=A0ABR9TR07_9FLAO|nr:hypothetical protein [Flavobacterium hungaricum]MBE8727489.1 hypothetical protein [Flavobacterium hungaricum]
MKKYIILSGMVMFLISCNQSQNIKNKALAAEQDQDFFSQNEARPARKPLKKLIFKNTDQFETDENLDRALLSKVASNLNIRYASIKLNETSSINYNDKTAFFVLTIAEHNKKMSKSADEEELGDYFQRKYLFVDRESGSIIAEEFDDNLGYYDNEAIRFSKSHILKDLVQLNEDTSGIAFYTEVSASSRIVLYSEQKFTILALADNEIKKYLYEYPIRLTNGDSNGSGTFQLETLETGMSFSGHKTHGFFDLIVTKNFSYEEAVEGDLENEIEGKTVLQTKKESQKLRFNGKEYVFNRDDRHRFLE